jgi:hypothetical protein
VRRPRRLLFLLLLCVPASAHAGDKCWPSANTAYTLSSVNMTPSAAGIDVRGFDEFLTLNFVKTAGTTINTAVEMKTEAGNWVPASGGPLTGSFHGSINPDHIVIHAVRLNTSTCTGGCSATVQLCSRPNAP